MYPSGFGCSHTMLGPARRCVCVSDSREGGGKVLSVPQQDAKSCLWSSYLRLERLMTAAAQLPAPAIRARASQLSLGAPLTGSRLWSLACYRLQTARRVHISALLFARPRRSSRSGTAARFFGPSYVADPKQVFHLFCPRRVSRAASLVRPESWTDNRLRDAVWVSACVKGSRCRCSRQPVPPVA